jgi:epoxyqueuosine reductase
MIPIQADKLKSMLERLCPEADALAVLPQLNLQAPLVQTLDRLDRGLVPESYGWTEEKTRRAYGYRGDGSWIRSIIVAAKSYYTNEQYPDRDGFIETGGKIRPYGRIARFTWRNNYRYLHTKLKAALGTLRGELGVPVCAGVFSNYTSIPEKVLFAASGLAAIGRNSVLIHGTMGSFFVVGEAVTDIPVNFSGTPFAGIRAPSPPDFTLCGSCSICMESCPTGAITEPGTIDVNRCLQYLSENLLPVSRDCREIWGNRLYGCTTCMDVCPFNERIEPMAEKHPMGRVGQGEDLVTLLTLSPGQWQHRFQDNQIAIRDRLAIIQNGLLCMGNLRYEQSLPVIAPYLSHGNRLIRIAAAWAVGRQETAAARGMLEKRFGKERDPLIREEIEFHLR